MSIVKSGTTGRTEYFNLLEKTAGTPKTGVTITQLLISYTRTRQGAVSTNCSALANTSVAWSSAGAIEVDSTGNPGLYRVDVPDGAYSTTSGVDGVILTLYANTTTLSVAPAMKEVQFDVNISSVTGGVGGAVGSVTGNVGGSVGSVVGNVGGLVSGSVGSVVGNVGGSVGSVVASVLANSVTGNVGGSVGSVVGNVGGAVASVTGNVGGSVGSVVGGVGGAVGSVTAAVAITSNIKKGQALSAFEFMMTDSTNHAPATGKTVTVSRSLDGAAFAAGTLSAVTEISNGMYKVDFGTGDTNGNVVVLRATATGCDDTFERIITQP